MQPDSWSPPQHRDEGEPEKTRWWDQDGVFPSTQRNGANENGSVGRYLTFVNICRLQQVWRIWILSWDWNLLLPASQSHTNTKNNSNTQIHPWSASQSLLVRNLCLPGTFSLTWLRSLKSLIQAGKILDGMNKKCTHQLNQTDIITSSNLQIIS